jgi:hypothetical protein
MGPMRQLAPRLPLAVAVLAAAAVIVTACVGKVPGAEDGGVEGCGSGCPVLHACVADLCLPLSCAERECLASEVCLDGACVGRACVGVSCPAEAACAGGACLPRACIGGGCGPSEVCIDDQCLGVQCVGIDCPSGTACARGHCLPTKCPTGACPAGQVCWEGACLDASCVGVFCEEDQYCRRGLCGSCPPGQWEDDESCVAQTELGSFCLVAASCLSERCVEGLCCSGSCAGACQACDLPGMEGTCSLLPSGAEGSPSCGEQVCSGTSGSCHTRCTEDTDCGGDEFCDGTACLQKQANGAPCARLGQCTSGLCVDGRCCDSECSGACLGCDVAGALGTCTPRPEGTVCAEVTYGDWGACSWGSTCERAGQQCREVTTYACSNQSCTSSTVQQCELGSCTRNTDGTACPGGTCWGGLCELDCTSCADPACMWSDCSFPGSGCVCFGLHFCSWDGQSSCFQ